MFSKCKTDSALYLTLVSLSTYFRRSKLVDDLLALARVFVVGDQALSVQSLEPQQPFLRRRWPFGRGRGALGTRCVGPRALVRRRRRDNVEDQPVLAHTPVHRVQLDAGAGLETQALVR